MKLNLSMIAMTCSLTLFSCAPLRNVYKEDIIKIKKGELEVEVNNLLGMPAKSIPVCENEDITMNIYFYCDRYRFADQATLLMMPSLSFGSADYARDCIKDRKSGFIIFRNKIVITQYLNNDIGKIFLIDNMTDCMKNSK